MATPVRDKYFLKTLHEDIGLMDRKIAHLLKYETFENEEDRTAAAAKLSTKRDQMAKTALQMANDGITYAPTQVPVAVHTTVTTPAASASTPDTPPAPQMLDAVYAGTSLDYRSGIEDYLRTRRKTA